MTKKLVEEWIYKAEEGFESAVYLAKKDKKAVPDSVCFHCQQCVDIVPALKGLVDQAAPLSEYAWKFRYPGKLKEPTEEEAEEALQTARAVYDTVLTRLPREVRP